MPADGRPPLFKRACSGVSVEAELGKVNVNINEDSKSKPTFPRPALRSHST
jgi:hypothetical protein